MVLPRLTPLRGAAGLVVGGVVGSVLLRKPEENDFAGAPLKRKIQRFQSLVDRGQDPQSLRKRSEMVAALKSGEEFDVLIVGAGCTGAGAALDAATRGLKTVRGWIAATLPATAATAHIHSRTPCQPCVERGD